MKWLLGLDEAGYGPNLGPLVVALSLWELTEPRAEEAHSARKTSSRARASTRANKSAKQTTLFAETETQAFDTTLSDVELFEMLAPEISRCDSARSQTWLRVDDSKRLYSASGGLESLEKVVLGASFSDACFDSIQELRDALLAKPNQDSKQTTPLPTSDSRSLHSRSAFQSLDHEAWNSLGRWTLDRSPSPDNDLPWYDRDDRLNTLSSREELAEIGKRFKELQAERGAHLKHVAARQVEPREFNLACERWENKASVLSLTSLALLRDSLESLPLAQGGSVLCRCDRHGGRARYAALLQTIFPEHWIEVLEETPQLSRYRFAWGAGQVEVRFQIESEQYLETAWASIHAKYLREQSMEQINQFFTRFDPDLLPTKGYPQDAKRYLNQVEKHLQREKIELERFWRNR